MAFVPKVPGNFIAIRNDRKQYVYIDDVSEGNDGEKIYGGYYGYMTTHEICIKASNLRELTQEERMLVKQHKQYLLPQEFYQSTPVF